MLIGVLPREPPPPKVFYQPFKGPEAPPAQKLPGQGEQHLGGGARLPPFRVFPHPLGQRPAAAARPLPGVDGEGQGPAAGARRRHAALRLHGGRRPRPRAGPSLVHLTAGGGGQFQGGQAVHMLPAMQSRVTSVMPIANRVARCIARDVRRRTVPLNVGGLHRVR